MLDLLINDIDNNIPIEECYFNLEPLYKRDDIITEDLLLYIFKLLFSNKNINEIINSIHSKQPNLHEKDIENLICNIFSGKTEIYPSELKRGNIPYPLYLYITTFYYKISSNTITTKNIISLWSNIKNLYNIDVKSVIIYNQIQNFLNINYDYRKKLQLKIQLTNSFTYFNSVYDRLHYTFKHSLNILNIFFNTNISLIINRYIIYDDIILFSMNIKKKISKIFKISNTNYIHRKYFEHLFFTRNINKLFNYIDINIII